VRTFTVFAAPGAPYVLLAGLPGICAPVPPIHNALLLAPPLVSLRAGSTSTNVVTSCGQGSGRFGFAMPAGAPSGVAIAYQAISLAPGGALAFTPAIEVAIP
jgi:hypothetical protein